MSRTLILMRHAKSSWNDPLLSDHDRSLNARGRKSALALGAWMRGTGLSPDQVLCSTAKRTRETLASLGLDGARAEFSGKLYHAGAVQLLSALAGASGKTVLLVAHNPGIGDLAHRMVRIPPAHPRFDDYPTGATLVARFDVKNWREVAPGTGEVLEFVVPRELT